MPAIKLLAQTAPSITYSPSTNVYSVGTAITTLSPANSGGAVSPANYGAVSTFVSVNSAYSIFIDGSNNVFTTDYSNGYVYKYNSAGTNTLFINTPYFNTSEVAVDGSGNIYVSCFSNNVVLKYSSTGTLLNTISGFSGPYGIAFDASNNAYVANSGSGNITKIAAGTATTSTFLSGFTSLYGIIIDASGNTYVSQQSQNNIIKVANGSSTKTTFATGFNSPKHLSEDAYGNIYVADYSNNAIKRISSTGIVTSIISTGLSSPRQAAFDSNGNLFEANYGTNTIKESLATTYAISATLPAGLSFSTTTGQITGTPTATSAASNYTITAYNTGGSGNTVVNITVNSGAPSVTNGTACGAGVVTLTASGGFPSGGTYNWYAASSGGTALQSTTSATYAPTVTSTKTFYVSYTSGGIETARTAVTATIYPEVSSPYSGAMLSYPFESNANDVSGSSNNGTLQASPTSTTDRYGVANTAYNFNGSTQYVSTAKSYVNPSTFTISLWFNTTTPGGRLIGFGANATGTNFQYDRHIYMNNAGQLYFGLWVGSYATINTTTSYSDGNWHHVIVTVGSGGSFLYVDGSLQVSDATMTTPENYTGYWRVGYDNLGIWTSAPTNTYFTGKLDDIAVYDHVLTAAEITASNDINQIGAYAPVCVGSALTIYAPTITGATYTWTDPSGATKTGQNPTFTSAIAGTYSLTVTGGPGGCSSTATYTPTLLTGASSAFTATSPVYGSGTSTVTYTGTDPATSTFTWDFGGGTPATGTGSGPFSVTWSTTGSKTITLTVTNTTGCSSTSTQTVVYSAALGGYGFSKPIVLNTSSITGGISTTLANFPALVYIQDNALKIGNVCGDKVQYPTGNGGGLTAGTNYDFAFTLAGSTTELNYQIDTYDQVNGILLAWVQISSLTSTNTSLTFYFGSASPTHTAAFATSTWSSDYLAVYHFSEGSAAATVLDATSNGRKLTQSNTTVSNDEIHVAAGMPVVGGGYSFNGTSSKIIQTSGTNPDITGKFTLSAWVYYNGTSSSDNKIISDELNYGHGYKMSVKSGKIETETRTTANPAPGNLLQTGTVSSATWTYIQGEYDGTKFINFVNGTASATTGTGYAPEAGNVISLGVDYLSSSSSTNFYNGYMDEVRISNVAKSADWIKAEYYNQSNPTTFTNYSGSVSSYPTNASALTGALVYTWTGTTSTDPTVASNWDIGQAPVFNSKTSFVVPVVGTGLYPALSADEGIYSLTISSGASFSLNGHILSVGCNIYNNTTTGGTGILNASNMASAINWNGSLAAQSYTGTNNSNTAVLGNMTVNNTASGTITIKSGPVDVYNLLTLTQGNLAIDNASNGLLTLKSTASQSAAVAVLPAACKITGQVSVERFLTGGNSLSNRGYRVLSSPVNQTSATIASTNTFNMNYMGSHVYNSITYAGAMTAGLNGATNGFTISNTNPTIYLYKEPIKIDNKTFTSGKHIGVTNIYTSGGIGVIDITDGTTTKAVPIGNGFIMYFVGPSSRTSGSTALTPADATMSATGYLNQQGFTVNLWYTPTGGANKLSNSAAALPGYNLVGNPYASTIDLSKVLTDNNSANGIDNIYILSAKNSPNQTYTVYTAAGTSAPTGTGGQGYALSGEGFLVHVKSTAGNNGLLTFSESEKAPAIQLTGTALIMTERQQQVSANGAINSNLSFNAPPPITGAIKDGLTGLYMKMEKDSLTYDYCGIYFGQKWGANFQDGDARDLDGAGPQVYMSSLSADGIRSAVKHFPDYRKGLKIKLYADGKTNGMYTLRMEGIRNIDTTNYKITLLDHFKKDSTDIGRYKSYAFNVLKNDTNTFGANRFELSIQQLPGARYQLATFTAQKATDGVLVTWRAYNEGSNYFFTLEKQQSNGTDYSPVYQTQSDGGTIYKYTDKIPNTGNNVYRLKQVDLFGNITYSAPVSIYYDNSGNASLFSLYPNPTVEKINVNVTYGKTNTAASTYKLTIYDVTGMMVLQKTAGSSTFSENVSQFKPGVYVVELKDNGGSSLGKAKFMKK